MDGMMGPMGGGRWGWMELAWAQSLAIQFPTRTQMDSYSKGIPFLFEPDFENLFGVECPWQMGKDHIRNHHQDESSAYLPYVLFSSKVPCDDVIESPRISKSTVGQARNLPTNSCFGRSTLWLRVSMTYGIAEYLGVCRNSYE